ncbi:MAG: hypothetical protein IPK07_17855 [Deltaproteobacteria bacterium]|nr:hypothetical protein [Deltaproteobacteria bacterium]
MPPSRRRSEYPIKRFVVDVLASNDGPLAVSELVECARWFGFRPGTLRVCLSRLVRGGLLDARSRGGRVCYGLAPPAERFNRAVRERVWFDQRRPWTGRWRLVLLAGAAMPRDVRDATAARLRAFHLQPIHPGVWARPENVRLGLRPLADTVRLAGGRIESFVARPDRGSRLTERAPELWRVDALEERFADQLARVEESRARLRGLPHQEALVECLRLGAATFRVVASDPLLPLELLGPSWPGERLRQAVIEYNHLACDVWSDAAFGKPARNPHPRPGTPPVGRPRAR